MNSAVARFATIVAYRGYEIWNMSENSLQRTKSVTIFSFSSIWNTKKKSYWRETLADGRLGEPYIAYPIYCNILQYMQYFHILLPEANIAICMVCPANIAILYSEATIYCYIGGQTSYNISQYWRQVGILYQLLAISGK